MSLRRHGKRKRNNRRAELLCKVDKLKAANNLARKRELVRLGQGYLALENVLCKGGAMLADNAPQHTTTLAEIALIIGAVQPKEVDK